jgi:hypothetical protein
MAEQWPFKPLVEGSSPSTLTEIAQKREYTPKKAFFYLQNLLKGRFLRLISHFAPFSGNSKTREKHLIPMYLLFFMF